MRMVRPYSVTAANLTSNVSITGTEYASTGTYALGATVINTTGTDPTYHEYESLVADNTGNALTDSSKWLDLGAINRFRMFDSVNGTLTTNASTINVTVAVTGRADGLGLLGLDAETVQVVVTAGVYGTVYDQTYEMVDNDGITSWYDYFTEDVVYSSDLVLTDLPLYTDPSIQVIITKAGTASCGTMVLGQSIDLGAALYGAQAGIIDYSRKETDDFGNTSLVERSYAKRSRFKLKTDNTRVDSIFRTLAQYRATPALWVGVEDQSATWAYGWARDWYVEFSMMEQSHISLEIEGLT